MSMLYRIRNRFLNGLIKTMLHIRLFRFYGRVHLQLEAYASRLLKMAENVTELLLKSRPGKEPCAT